MGNVRFWIYWNGTYSRVTMRPGGTFELSQGGPTDEGWNWTRERYTFDGEVVTSECADEGCDCDGRLDRYSEWVCPVSDLAIRPGHEDYEESRGLMLPEWQKASAYQRDYAAEAAGY